MKSLSIMKGRKYLALGVALVFMLAGGGLLRAFAAWVAPRSVLNHSIGTGTYGSYQLNDTGEVTLGLDGRLVWDAVTTKAGGVGADGYEVTVHNDDDGAETGGDIVETVAGAAYEPYALPDGTYTATVKAAHTSPWVEDSAVVSAPINFKVEHIASYTAADIDTTSGKFETGQEGLTAAYNGETGLTKLNAGNNAGWGSIQTKAEAAIPALNMSKNPLVVLHTEGADGGYYFNFKYDGLSGYQPALGDTYTGSVWQGSRTAVINANRIVSDPNPLTVPVTNFHFQLGATARVSNNIYNGNNVISYVYLSGIDVVYINLYTPPPAAVKLDAPTLNKSGAAVLVAPPENKYIDADIVYDITVTDDSTTAEVVSYEDTTATTVNLAALPLVSGKTYTVSVTAKPVDGQDYHTESDPAELRFGYTEKCVITDFTSIAYSRRDGGGIFASVDEKGITYYCGNGGYIVGALHIDVTGIELTADSAVIHKLSEVVLANGATQARYIHGFIKDTGGARDAVEMPVSPGEIIADPVFAPNTANFQGTYVINNMLYVASGMGGDAYDRAIILESLAIADYALLPNGLTVSPASAEFDKNAPEDLEFTLAFTHGAAAQKVSNGAAVLNAGTDYVVDGDALTLKKEYMATLPFGLNTVRVTDTRGYAADIALTVTTSAESEQFDAPIAQFDSADGTFKWSAVDDAFSGYEIEAYLLSDWGDDLSEATPVKTADTKANANGTPFNATSWVVAADNLTTGKYAARVRAAEVLPAYTASEWSDFVYLDITRDVFWDAQEIPTVFDGAVGGYNTETGAQHAAATYDSESGVVRIAPSRDGWGILASPQITLDINASLYVGYHAVEVVSGANWSDNVFTTWSNYFGNKIQNAEPIPKSLCGTQWDAGVQGNGQTVRVCILVQGANNAGYTAFRGMGVYHITEYTAQQV
ncbi:MAG: hypothetical protein LBL66_04200 [Clostridiales bacterium]|nr:hypothetical protein [Clostridiales bacterium]